MNVKEHEEFAEKDRQWREDLRTVVYGPVKKAGK